MRNLRLLIFIIISSLLIVSCNISKTKNLELKKGFIDLSSWNFEKDGIVNLNGEWEFYWEQLLEPKDFKRNNLYSEYIYVPRGWAVQKAEKKSYPEFGYATYRLKINMPDNRTDYKFRFFGAISSSANVWVNEEFYFERGQVGINKENSKPEHTFDFNLTNQINKNNSDTLEIIIQVADFYHGGSFSGLSKKISIGHSNQIYKAENRAKTIRAAIIGILLLIGLYHFFLFVYGKNKVSYFIFSLMCLLVIFRISYTSGLFVDIFSYDLYRKIGFAPTVFFPALILVFFYLQYREGFHKKILIVFLATAIIFLPFIFVGTSNGITKLEPFVAFYSPTVLLYLLSYSLFKAVKRKRQGSVLDYIGTLILLGSFFHDALFFQGIIFGFGYYIVELVFGFYILLQSLNLAKIFSHSLKENINLNKELDFQNKNLEKIVENRTKELKYQNEEITNSINYAQKIQSAILTPETYVNEVLHENFIFYKPRDIVSGDFYWIKQINQYIVIVAADCTGHGVPGALMSMLGISYLNEIVQRREITKANQVLNELRSQIKHSLRQHGQNDETKDGIDMALCVIDTKSKAMQYAGAYNPLYLIRDKKGKPQLEEIKADKMPVGFHLGKDKAFNNNELQLETGDTFYIFSDGFADQIGGEYNKKFMSKNLKGLLLEIYDLHLNEQKEILDKKLKNWMNGNPQIDDILIVGVRV